tara:strand:- start:1420 stop:1536 length:117 start_codon:yes stop_codon:yes gene_type:complete
VEKTPNLVEYFKIINKEKVLNNQTLSLWIIYVERLIVY